MLIAILGYITFSTKEVNPWVDLIIHVLLSFSFSILTKIKKKKDSLLWNLISEFIQHPRFNLVASFTSIQIRRDSSRLWIIPLLWCDDVLSFSVLCSVLPRGMIQGRLYLQFLSLKGSLIIDPSLGNMWFWIGDWNLTSIWYMFHVIYGTDWWSPNITPDTIYVLPTPAPSKCLAAAVNS